MLVHKTAVLNHSPEIGEDTSIGEFCVIQNYEGRVKIGAHCDIAARVSINCSDSHLRCIGLSDEIEYLHIEIEDHVYIGEGAIILGGCFIGHHSVIGAGTLLAKNTYVESYSLVIGNPGPGKRISETTVEHTFPIIKQGYYASRLSNPN